jgi:hypothetical protein
MRHFVQFVLAASVAGLGAWALSTISTQKSVKADPPQVVGAPADQNEPAAMLSEAELRAAGAERRNVHATKFEAEGVDASWASRKEARVAARFGRLKTAHKLSAEVTELTCHSATCKLYMRFPTWETGLRELRRFASRLSASEGCGHFFSAPPPENKEGVYETEVFLLCGSQKSGETPEMQ